jgi:hypothetical protein
MRKRLFASIATLAFAAFAGGCAQTDDKARSDVYSAPITRTGSNLPVGRERDQAKAEGLSDAERLKLESELRRTAPRRSGGT